MMVQASVRIQKISLLFIITGICFLGCGIADISQDSPLLEKESEAIATQKIEEIITFQGFDVMKKKNVYCFEAIDDWKGIMGGMAKIWPDKNTRFKFCYNFNTFDGNALFLSGKKQGNLIGVQSWRFYEKTKNTDTILVKDTGSKHNPLEFGVVIYHYFIELAYRLRNAPIRRYYGQKTYKKQRYDLVFASWESEAPNPKYDQYILWINTKTKLVEYCMYTVRTNTNPLTRHKYGSIAFEDYSNVDGFKVPTKMTVMIDDDVIKKPSLENYFHRFTIQDFSFGEYNEAVLYPIKNLKKQIDSKSHE
ncbi:hypothetical protein [Aquimarina aquimarini]|uniref:hypothetical protein n=1 Tax=Aquimarina aquimarini TaxID=1191734 RepID=UPI001F24C289|nr:hypothetical protein [Aquimarina aquimarini]